MSKSLSAEVARELQTFRYREAFHLSYAQLLDEPLEEIERASVIWALDDKRAKLESERQKHQA